MIEPTANGATESMRGQVLYRSQRGKLRLERCERPPRCIRAAIVHDNDLMRHVMLPKFEIEMLDCGCNAALLISSWHKATIIAQVRSIHSLHNAGAP